MPWVVGIDEAGYGPNLGPLVQAAVALRLPDGDLAGWETLKPWVRRAHEKDDGRLLIDDSKKVYAGAKGFEKLELTAMCALAVAPDRPATMKDLIANLFPEFLRELEAEFWFQQIVALPNETDIYTDHFGRMVQLIHGCGGSYYFRPRVVPTPHFNRRIDESGSKATVLADGLIQFLSDVASMGRAGIDYSHEPVAVICDKQGGRNFYGPILQEAFPDGWVVAERESAAESRYRILNLNRDVGVVFRPKADGDSVCVALASMICKYLRELCMGQFNAFWQKHVPGLLPTAGYPVDAKRFYAEIRPAMEKLGIPPDAVWRKK